MYTPSKLKFGGVDEHRTFSFSHVYGAWQPLKLRENGKCGYLAGFLQRLGDAYLLLNILVVR